MKSKEPLFSTHPVKRAGIWPARLILISVFIFTLLISSVVTQAQVTLEKPQWSVGLSWEVGIHNKSIISPMDRPGQQQESFRVWHFSVERELILDGALAFAIAVTCSSKDCGTESYKLFYTQEGLSLRRIEVYPSGWEGKKIVHLYRRSGVGPTVTHFGYVPFAMPVFDQPDEMSFTYEHCVNGPNGFVQKVTQTVESRDDHLEVQLTRGNRRIFQKWRSGLPWAVYTSSGNGHIVAELIESSISDIKKMYPLNVVREELPDNGNIDTLKEFGPPVSGRWWPLSATISKRPWSPYGEDKRISMLDTTDFTSIPAWSGYWWPMLDSDSGERLWHDNGPLDKYDYYVHARTGDWPSPYATTWEYENHRTTDKSATWWGHCNGWAAASIREPEPGVACWLQDIYFSVADKKGILTEWHNSTLSDWDAGDRYYGENGDDLQDIYPYEFITALIQYIVNQDEAIVMDLDCQEEVWNHPIYGFEMVQVDQYDNQAKFTLKVYYATDGVEPDFVGTWEEVVKYEFWCTVDAYGNPTYGESSWSGESTNNHPDFLWHPGSDHSTGNSALTSQYVHEIVQSTPQDYAHIEIRHTYRGDLVVRLGAGNPAAPGWVTTITDEEGGSVDNLILDVDISEATSYLPPGMSQSWFLEVTDNAEGDEGTIQAFSIRYDSVTYNAINLSSPVPFTDGETSYAYIGAVPPQRIAHIDVQHSYRGDLDVMLGVGDPSNPTWSKVVNVHDSEDDEEDLVMDVDISEAASYLPPSSTLPWFIKVTDNYEEDMGSIQAFTINYDGSVYRSTDTPVEINDLQTIYAYIRPTSSICQAHIDIQHTWRGDLVVTVGVGDPSNPVWSTTVSDREGEDTDNIVVNVDVSAAETYLPPDSTYPWFIEVYDAESGDTGTIQAFTITYNDAIYGADGLPIAIMDLQTSYATISTASAFQAHIDIQHTYRGDLVVRLGAGNPASPRWVQIISNREGGELENLIRDIDLSSAKAYLPPDGSHPWFLEVSDNAEGDEGIVKTFFITYQGATYNAGALPLSILDGQTCYAYIGSRHRMLPWLMLLLE